MHLLYRLSFITALVLLTAYNRAPLYRDSTVLPGCVLIGEHMSMAATEVTLAEYGDFIIKNHCDSSLYPADSALPDQYYRFIIKNFKGARSMDYLWIHMGRKPFQVSERVNYAPFNYPVVGITYEQAVRFCKWKEATTNGTRPMYRWIRVSLPSIEVYRQVIEETDSLHHPRKPRPCYFPTFNYRSDHCIESKMDMQAQGHFFVRVDAYWPTQLGLYCIRGNAAEMTSTKGIAMGGSFRDYAIQSDKDQHQSYSGLQSWLGFRYIVTPQADNP